VSRLLALFLAAVLVACGAAAALVLIDSDEPGGSAIKTGTTRQMPAETSATLVVRSGGWTILRNQPFGIAIGNAHAGWGIDASYPPKNPHYIAGYVRGDFKGCAWTSVANVVRARGPVKKICSWYDPSIKSFASKLNCWCSGGTAVLLTSPAREYANFRNRVGGYNYLRTVPAQRCVEWRWVSLDKTMVMVKDRAFANDRGSWVFIPRTSLPVKLPRGYPYSCTAGHRRK